MIRIIKIIYGFPVLFGIKFDLNLVYEHHCSILILLHHHQIPVIL